MNDGDVVRSDDRDHRDDRHDNGGHAAEALRQQQLMASVAAAQPRAGDPPTRERGARALRGMQAYRANAEATVARALASAFPTVRELLGEADFDHLACEFWRAEPPVRGDQGEWGAALPAFIHSHQQLAQWPYLSDSARLDWAIHACERAADAQRDDASFARLGDTDPSKLALVFMPGLALVESDWPIAQIHAVHQATARDDEAAFEVVRDAIAARHPESVVVARRGWKAVVTRIDPSQVQWLRTLLSGTDLGTALEQAGERLDFAAWLADALRHEWLKEVAVTPD